MATKQEVVAQAQRNAQITVNNAFIDSLSAQIQEKMKYGLSFPADYNYTNALTGAYLSLLETTDKNGKPILNTCSQSSIANSLMDMVTLGLSVQKKQGYFIAYGGKCQFQKSYFGNIAIARRYGLKSCNAQVIYEGDDFEYHIEDGVKVLDKHTQSLANINNDKIIGAYAVAIMDDGTKYLEVMTMEQIKAAWRQGYGYKEGSGTHSKFTDQMAKKTVTNRAMKYITNTYGDSFVQTADENTEDIPTPDKVVADVDYEIEQNANQIDFPEDDIVDEQEAPQEPSGGSLPDFMKQETV